MAEPWDLRALAMVHGTDKWGAHWYAAHYDRHLRERRSQVRRVLEIGVGGYDDPSEGGASLRMWRDYFPEATIIGVDIHDKSMHDGERILTVQGNQSDSVFLKRLGQDHGPFDLVVDDGSHVNAEVIATFHALFPFVVDGGTYAIEDLQSGYWPGTGGSSIDTTSTETSVGFVKSLIDSLNFRELLIDGYEPTYLDEHIVALHCFHNLVLVVKGDNDERSNLVQEDHRLPDSVFGPQDPSPHRSRS
jgi:demethylmacrocin O-methyltransferase